MKVEERKEFIINIFYFALVLSMIYIGLKYFLGILFPFVLGFFIAFMLMPIIKSIRNKIKINNTLITVLVLLLFYSIIGTGVFFLILKIISLLNDVFELIPRVFSRDIQPLINQFVAWANDFFYRINPDITDYFQQFEGNIFDQLSNIVRSFSSGAINVLTSFVTRLPRFFISLLIAIVSSFFIAIDYKNIYNFFRFQITDKNRRLLISIKRNGVDVLVNFFKAYSIILGITFLESAIGLSILGINNAIGISLIIAMVDILPILGTGTILVPWTIIEVINGNYKIALGLGLLYATITVVRQILEPRVVGESIGLHPVITLLSMYLGVHVFGILGLLVLPIVVTLVVKLHEEGVISFYKDPKNQAIKQSKSKDDKIKDDKSKEKEKEI